MYIYVCIYTYMYVCLCACSRFLIVVYWALFFFWSMRELLLHLQAYQRDGLMDKTLESRGSNPGSR